MNAARVVTLLAAFSLATAAQLLAQQAGDEDDGGRSLCFEGGPLTFCSSFLLTQARVLYRLSPEMANSARWYMMADLGWMRNISQRDALGLSAFGGLEFGLDETLQYGVRGRYRRWVGERSSVDVSAGVVFGTASDAGGPGFSSTMDFTVSDLFLATVGLDYANSGSCAFPEGWPDNSCETEYEMRTYLGIGFGSKLGLVAFGIAGLVGLALALSGSGF